MPKPNPEEETYGFFSIVDQDERVSSLMWSNKRPGVLQVVGILPHGAEIRPKTVHDAQQLSEWFAESADRWGPLQSNPPVGVPTDVLALVNPQTSMPFGADHTGTWIDGAFGDDHAREKMKGMLEAMIDLEGIEKPLMSISANRLYAELDDADNEFVDETLNEATELLQGSTREGYVWSWEAGDLVLFPPDDDE